MGTDRQLARGVTRLAWASSIRVAQGPPPQFFLGALQVLDVGARCVPFDDVAPLVAQRDKAQQKPAIFSVGPPQTPLLLERLSSGEPCMPVVHGAVFGMQCIHPGPAAFLYRDAGIVTEPFIRLAAISELLEAAGIVSMMTCSRSFSAAASPSLRARLTSPVMRNDAVAKTTTVKISSGLSIRKLKIGGVKK